MEKDEKYPVTVHVLLEDATGAAVRSVHLDAERGVRDWVRQPGGVSQLSLDGLKAVRALSVDPVGYSSWDDRFVMRPFRGLSRAAAPRRKR